MIAAKVFNLESFKKQYKALQTLSVCESIKNLKWYESKDQLLKKINWNNILGIASILSYSEISSHLDAALRISQTCLTSDDTSESHKAGATVILENLTNVPALNLAINRKLIQENFEQEFPIPFKLQTNKIKLENSIIIDEKVISLNRFQKKVFDAYTLKDCLSISAPTSAGKSFILYQLLIKELQTKNKNIVYIVPTRALISQVEEDLRLILISHSLKDVNLTSVPTIDSSDKKTNLYVFTQERLHWFLSQPNSKLIDLLIIDEAHKIDNGNRGILLQRKIEDVLELNPKVRIFFSSPFTSNPEILLEGINRSNSKQTINTEFIAVNQNLLYVNQIPRKPKEWEISLVLINEIIPIGIVELKDRPTTEPKKITLIAEAISGNQGGSLIYANGAAEAEKYAKVLQDLIGKENITTKIKDLGKLVKNIVHKDYALGKVLDKKIAFHYGNMPLIIRQEIENLFKENQIKYLICTSTLLEGVNLPATAVFVRKPTRGRGKPLNENDFWNLAGRAGRWGKEFSGNIICIEPNNWEIKPSPNKKKQKIRKALDVIENDRSNELLSFISEGSPRIKAESNQDLEFAFSYYYSRFLQKKISPDSSFKNKLISEFKILEKKITIPNYIIFKNPGISPIAQQELYEYFVTKKDDIISLIPVYPEDANSYIEYTKLVGRIGKTLAAFPPQLNASRAILLINWMTGKPLSYLISSSYKNYKKNKKNVKIGKVIRETMEQVENFARFRFAKESSCYIDILRFFLKEIDRHDLLDDIPDLNLWLEFGVSQTTQLSLLSLGLSRNTVVAISEYITNTNLSKKEVLSWLREIDLEKLNLSPIMVIELNNVI